MKKEKIESIKNAIQEVIESMGDNNDDATERILKTLDEQRIFRYQQDDEIGLLATPGRVLLSIIRDPTMTIRAIAIYLNMSETNIDKTIKTLLIAGLITKTKLNKQNVYQINKNSILKQPDIHFFLLAIQKMEQDESSEFELF